MTREQEILSQLEDLTETVMNLVKVVKQQQTTTGGENGNELATDI